MQSSQRSTSDATSPSSSLVLADSAPSSYARVSRLKNRWIPRCPHPRIFSFIVRRYSLNSSMLFGMVSLVAPLDDAHAGKILVDRRHRAVVLASVTCARCGGEQLVGQAR